MISMLSSKSSNSLAIRIAVWLLGIFLSLPAPCLDACVCVESFGSFCCSCSVSEARGSTNQAHLAATRCPKNSRCQCHQDGPQHSTISSRKGRILDDIDVVQHLTAGSTYFRFEPASLNLLAAYQIEQPAITVLQRCAILVRFLL